jgi:hypothetical protein
VLLNIQNRTGPSWKRVRKRKKNKKGKKKIYNIIFLKKNKKLKKRSKKATQRGWNVGLQEARQYQRKSQKELFGKEV